MKLLKAEAEETKINFYNQLISHIKWIKRMIEKTIYLLIGPKGSGKSFIGNLIDDRFGIKFIRVEDWAKKIKRERTIGDDTYLKEVFQTIEKGIRSELLERDKLVFESTGLTDYFDEMLINLKADIKVITIGIKAESGLCLERVKKRDQSIHINISDEMIISINRKVRKRNLVTDYVLINENKTVNHLVDRLKLIL